MQKIPEWKILQSLGEKEPVEVSEDDTISALQFDKTGTFLSLGDQGGRLIIFNTEPAEKGKKITVPVKEYEYLTEFQSHQKEFDCLKSEEIRERINQIQWLRSQGNNMYILTCNDKTIKLWKVSEKTKKKAISLNSSPENIRSIDDIKFPELKTVQEGYAPSQPPKIFPSLHNYHINALSVFSTDSNFLSADDLRIYYWDINRPQEAYSAIDIKPEDDQEEVSEVITSCKVHPTSDALFGYSTSKGIINLCDLRISSMDSKRICQTFSETIDPAARNFFTDVLVNISDICLAPNGKYIYSRDYLSVKIWDMSMTTKPISTINLYDPLKAKLCEAYENEYILDKFTISVSPCSNICATGMYNSNFHVVDSSGTNNIQFEHNYDRQTKSRLIPKKCTDKLTNYDFNLKTLATAWHPTTNVVAAACQSSVFFYQGK